jgi:adenylate cyclase ExoY
MEISKTSITIKKQYLNIVDKINNEQHTQQEIESSDLSEATVNNIFEEHSIGIIANHAIKMQKIAQEKNIIFGIRPVEPIVKTLIEEGYPTKDLNVKGKSSNWGPQAGFICKEQFFSKKNGDSEKIKALNAEIETGLLEKNFGVTELEIGRSRVEELCDKLGIIETTKKQDDLLIYAKSPSSNVEIFFAKYNHDKNNYAIYNAEDNKPIEVLCDLKLKKPLTADYDLLLLSTPIEEYKTNALDNRSGKIAIFKDTKFSTEEKVEYIAKNQDKKFGNSTKRVENLLNEVNDTLGRGEGLDVMHHADDVGNPYTNINDNFPATFFLPKKIGDFDKITVIENKQMFDIFITAIKHAGFHFEDHPNWNTPRRPRFEEALNKFRLL